MSNKFALALGPAFLLFLLVHPYGEEVLPSRSNKAASVRILKADFAGELAGSQAPEGKLYLALDTEWENIHPKQKIEKSKLEKKQDRTMGAGGLMGGKAKSEEEYVEADVAYKIPNLFDHAYCLADGKSYPLDKLTEQVPGGVALKKAFTIEKYGERKRVNFVYLVPRDAKNLAFQFFDYSFGHILVPIKGELRLARGAEGEGGKFLDQLKDNFVELEANKLDFQAEFKGEKAPEGWQYAVVELGGKSLSSGNIIQIRPKDYLWLRAADGYLYYCAGATTVEGGLIRFTPEVYQNREVAFLVPAAAKNFALGVRIKNNVYTLKLNPRYQPEVPKALASHRDGNTMEIFVYGLRHEDDKIILDLGVKSLVNSGIDIQTGQQFILKSGEGSISFDETSTKTLFHRPPGPFTIPPQTFVRFELAYRTDKTPTALYYRGYESENSFKLPGK